MTRKPLHRLSLGLALAVMTAFVAAFGAAISACGTSDAALSNMLDAATDAFDAAGDADAASAPDAPLRPYPPGPYGGAIGDTMPDFTVLGYAMSPTQRDSTKLPFGPISLSQVRSARDCGCMVIIWNAAGFGCSWCGLEEETLGSAVVEDPSMCVLEVLGSNFDNSGGTMPQPTTRADLDQRTQTAQQAFPVGIATDPARVALSATSISAVPENFVVRATDMKLVGFIDGVGTKIADQARALCANPHPGIETVATGLDPRRIEVDDGMLYVADGTHGFLKQDVGKQPLAPPVVVDPRPAKRLAVDADAIYFTAANTDGTFAIVRHQKSDGTRADLTTSPNEFLAVAVDTGTGPTAQVSLFFARADGVVGMMPKTGGAVTTLVSGESLAPTIAAGPSYVFFVSSATLDIARVSRTTAVREIYYPHYVGPNGVRFAPQELVMNKEGLFFTGITSAGDTALQAGALFQAPPDAGAPPTGVAGASVPSGVARDPSDDAILLAFRSDWLATTGILGRHDMAQFWWTTTPGVPDARALAGDSKTVYFTTDESAAGASDGTVKRILK